jgi:hypothetical protein
MEAARSMVLFSMTRSVGDFLCCRPRSMGCSGIFFKQAKHDLARALMIDRFIRDCTEIPTAARGYRWAANYQIPVRTVW